MDVGWNFRREHLRLAHARPLRDHQRRRSAQRGPAERIRLVLLPRSRLRPHHESVANRRQHGEGRYVDDRYHFRRGCSEVRGRGISTSRSPKRCMRISRRSDCRCGRRTTRRWPRRSRRNWGAGERSGDEDFERCARPVQKKTREKKAAASNRPAAAPTISATFPGSCRPSHCVSPRTFPAVRVTTGPMAISMATPIAHKGVIAGAKVQAMTMIDILTASRAGESELGLFQQCSNQGSEICSFLRPDDKPAIWLNEKIMAKYRTR